jgi:transcriptional regulator with XRE-family HTH domain
MSKSLHSAEYAALCQKLLAMRKAANLSQRELGRRLSVPASWVSKVETGERRIDLIEFGWFSSACGFDPASAARDVLTPTDLPSRNSKKGYRR